MICMVRRFQHYASLSITSQYRSRFTCDSPILVARLLSQFAASMCALILASCNSSATHAHGNDCQNRSHVCRALEEG